MRRSKLLLLVTLAAPIVAALAATRREPAGAAQCDMRVLARALLADTARLKGSTVKEPTEQALEGSQVRLFRDGVRVRRVAIEDMDETGRRRLDVFAADSANMLLVQVISKYRKPIAAGGSAADATETLRIAMVCGGVAVEPIAPGIAQALAGRVRLIMNASR